MRSLLILYTGHGTASPARSRRTSLRTDSHKGVGSVCFHLGKTRPKEEGRGPQVHAASCEALRRTGGSCVLTDNSGAASRFSGLSVYPDTLPNVQRFHTDPRVGALGELEISAREGAAPSRASTVLTELGMMGGCQAGYWHLGGTARPGLRRGCCHSLLHPMPRSECAQRWPQTADDLALPASSAAAFPHVSVLVTLHRDPSHHAEPT